MLIALNCENDSINLASQSNVFSYVPYKNVWRAWMELHLLKYVFFNFNLMSLGGVSKISTVMTVCETHNFLKLLCRR